MHTIKRAYTLLINIQSLTMYCGGECKGAAHNTSLDQATNLIVLVAMVYYKHIQCKMIKLGILRHVNIDT